MRQVMWNQRCSDTEVGQERPGFYTCLCGSGLELTAKSGGRGAVEGDEQ